MLDIDYVQTLYADMKTSLLGRVPMALSSRARRNKSKHWVSEAKTGSFAEKTANDTAMRFEQSTSMQNRRNGIIKLACNTNNATKETNLQCCCTYMAERKTGFKMR